MTITRAMQANNTQGCDMACRHMRSETRPSANMQRHNNKSIFI